MAGNAWEWCLNEHVIPKQTDLSGSSRWRVVRSGSWFNTQDSARTAFRGRVFPGYCHSFLGFRVVCSSPILNH